MERVLAEWGQMHLGTVDTDDDLPLRAMFG